MDLDCQHCKNQINAYVAGELSESDIDRVEAHMLHCGDCRTELQMERRLARSMKALAAREAVHSQVRAGLVGWLLRRNRFSQVGLLTAALLIAVIFPLSWKHSETSGLRHQLSESQNRQQELAEEIGRKQERLNALTEKAQSFHGIIKNSHPVRITGSRSSGQIIEIDKDETLINLEIFQTPDFDDYRFVLENQEGLEVFREEGLYPDGDHLRLTLLTTKITAGNYVITIQATQDGADMDSPIRYPVKIKIN